MTIKRFIIILATILATLSSIDAIAQEVKGDGAGSQTVECTDELFADAESAYQRRYDARHSATFVYRADKLIRKIVAICPDAKLNPVFQTRIESLGEQIADHELRIAKYYNNSYRANGHGLKGVQARLRKIVNDVPKYSKLDEVLFLLGEAYLLYGEVDKAKETFKSLSDRFPFSDFAKQAELVLKKSNAPDYLF